MKKLLGIIMTIMMALPLSSNAQTKKVLVAYFSHTGENYAVGNITKGNTCIIAEMIAKETNGTLFEIKPVKAYPTTYQACTEQAKTEKDNKARPAIKDDVKVENYDVIYIGYPNWWGDMPMPVYTFIEKHSW
jgi:flavodoxin